MIGTIDIQVLWAQAQPLLIRFGLMPPPQWEIACDGPGSPEEKRAARHLHKYGKDGLDDYFYGTSIPVSAYVRKDGDVIFCQLKFKKASPHLETQSIAMEILSETQSRWCVPNADGSVDGCVWRSTSHDDTPAIAGGIHRVMVQSFAGIDPFPAKNPCDDFENAQPAGFISRPVLMPRRDP